MFMFSLLRVIAKTAGDVLRLKSLKSNRFGDTLFVKMHLKNLFFFKNY